MQGKVKVLKVLDVIKKPETFRGALLSAEHHRVQKSARKREEKATFVLSGPNFVTLHFL